MAGSLSSLGLGSGTLTSDVIDSLRAADESILVDPIDSDIDENQEKTADLSTLTTIIAGLKTTTSDLSNDNTYLQRSTSVVGSSVTATANSGVEIQDIDIEVQQLAKQSVFQSSSTFSSLDSNIITSGTNNIFEFYLGTSKKTVELEDGAVSLSDLITAINDQYGDDVTASSLNVGDGQYKFILKSDDTGYDNQIWFGNSVNSIDLSGSFPKTVGVNDILVNGNQILTSDITADDMTDLVQQLNDAVASDESLNIFFIEDGDKFKVVSTDGKEVALTGGLVGQPVLDKTTTTGVSTPARDRDNYTDPANEDRLIKSIDYNFTSGTTDRLETIKIYDTDGNDTGKYLIIKEYTNNTFRLDGEIGGVADNQNFNNIDDLIDYLDNNFDADFKTAFYNYSERAPAGAIITENTTNAVLNGLGGTEQLTKAKDAKFTFSGVEIRRDSNVVNDLIVGLNLELQDTGNSTVKIKRDDDGLKDTVSEMVAAYNQVLNKLNELTDFNEDTGVSGSFQGVSEVVRIKSTLNRLILSSDFSQDIHNLVDLGIELNESGLLTFDESKLNEKLSEDPEAVEKFLRGYTSTVNGKEVEFEGVFTKMNDELNALIGDTGSLTYLDQNLKDRKENLEEEREKAVERLDARYEIMAAKFAAYDSIIATMNNSFNALQMQIDMLVSDKS